MYCELSLLFFFLGQKTQGVEREEDRTREKKTNYTQGI